MSVLDSAMNSLSSIAQSVNSAVNTHNDYKYNSEMLRLQMERDQVKLDRQVLADKFSTTQKALTSSMQSFFDEQVQNPDYNSYQSGWDSKYDELMSVDSLKTLGGLTDEEAQRFINERGNAIKLGGDNMVAMNKSVSARNYLATSYEAFSKLEQNSGRSLDESYSILTQKYEAMGGKAIDISGKSDPSRDSNRYSLALGNAQFSGKQMMERAISDPEYSIDDALSEFEKKYDENMAWVNASDPSVLADMQAQKATMESQMVQYYQAQNSIDYARSIGKVEKQSAELSQAITDGKIIDENAFSMSLQSSLDMTKKNDQQTYLTYMLNAKKHNASFVVEAKASDRLSSILNQKLANSENIEDAKAILEEAGISKDDKDYYKYLNQVYDYEEKIRSGEENRAKAVFKAAETDIKMMISSGDYAGDSVAYGHNGILSNEDIASGNVSLSNSTAEGLWSISAGSDTEIPAISTAYGSIVDEIADKYGITDPDEKRLLASYVNNAALEMSRAEASESSISKSMANWTAGDMLIYQMATDINNVSSKDVLSTYNAMDAQGMISTEFKDYFNKTLFGDDGSKRDSAWTRKASQDVDAFKTLLKTETSDNVSNRLLYMMDSNGELFQRFEIWEMSHPNATDDERTRFMNDLVIGVSSQNAADDIQNIISEGYRYATGQVDTSPLDDIESIEQVQKFRDGTYSYLIDESATATLKKKLYSDSAESMNLKEAYNIVVGDITNGRYKTLKELEDTKDLSDREKTMYKNLTYITTAAAVSDVVMYKQAEQVAHSIDGSFGIAPNAGKNLKEVHVTGMGNAVMDEAGIVYIANGKDSVDIYMLDNNSTEYKLARSSSNASVYPTSLTAGGTYKLTHAVEKSIEYVDAGDYSRITEGYNSDFMNKKGKFSEGTPVPEVGSLAYYGKGGYAKKPSDRQEQIDSANGKKKYTYIKDEKNTLSYMQNDPALYQIIERLFQ